MELSLVSSPLVEDTRPAAILKGSARGLELVVRGTASIEAIVAALTTRLEEAPAFFRGSDVRVRVEDGPLVPGCLARLDEIACRFELRIVEVGAAKPKRDDAVPQAGFAAGSAPAPAPAPAVELVPEIVAVAPPEPPPLEPAPTTHEDWTATIAPALPADAWVAEVVSEPVAPLTAASPIVELERKIEGARVVVGPVRSGVILDHAGHLVVFGDVNPGAEIRAEGNIVVLGRLRGTAHAGIGRDAGFILALRLEPQQLRICRLVARAGDSDAPSAEPELAHVDRQGGDTIIVERYQGRLPRSLVPSI